MKEFNQNYELKWSHDTQKNATKISYKIIDNDANCKSAESTKCENENAKCQCELRLMKINVQLIDSAN